MVQFASYVRRVLHKTRLIFSRINGPIDFVRFQVVLSYNFLDDFRATAFSAMILGLRLALNNQDLCGLVKIS